MKKITVSIGIDSAMYQDEQTINLDAYANAVFAQLRERFPEYKFSVSVFEDDNAETEISPDDIEAVNDALVEIESDLYSDPEMWE